LKLLVGVRKPTEDEIKANDKRMKEWKFDMKEIIAKAKLRV
jgi:hypothetical protein